MTEGTVSVYVDGVFVDNVRNYTENGSQLKCEGFVLGNDQDVVMGDWDPDAQFVGSVHDLKIYSISFSEEDVQEQY